MYQSFFCLRSTCLLLLQVTFVKKNMFGSLRESEVNEVLKHQLVGRIACTNGREPYIVPISYAFEGDFIYCHSEEGRKVEIMRSNPRVCFQADEMLDMANWKSVVIEGEFEELKEKGERTRAMEILLGRYLPMISSVTMHLGDHWPFEPEDEKDIKGVIFRIRILRRTGRYESNIESPAFPW